MSRVFFALAFVLGLLPVYALDGKPIEGHLVDRAQFGPKFALISNGMPEEQVRSILGPPDEISRDEPNISDEVWSYGTKGPRTMATLGQVWIKDRKASGARGTDEYVAPPSTNIISELELRENMRELNRVGPWDRQDCDGQLSYIRGANLLIRLGTPKGLAVITELCRARGPGILDCNYANVAMGNSTFPTYIVDDVPYDLSEDFSFNGQSWPLDDYLNKRMKGRTLRKKVLVPPDDPFPSYQRFLRDHLESAVASGRELGLTREYCKYEAWSQLRGLIQNVYKLGRRFPASDKDFDRAHAEFLKVHSHWDRINQRYVFKDGSFLSDSKLL